MQALYLKKAVETEKRSYPGSTGSVGMQARGLSASPDLKVIGLAAGRNCRILECRTLGALKAALWTFGHGRCRAEQATELEDLDSLRRDGVEQLASLQMPTVLHAVPPRVDCSSGRLSGKRLPCRQGGIGCRRPGGPLCSKSYGSACRF